MLRGNGIYFSSQVSLNKVTMTQNAKKKSEESSFASSKASSHDTNSSNHTRQREPEGNIWYLSDKNGPLQAKAFLEGLKGVRGWALTSKPNVRQRQNSLCVSQCSWASGIVFGKGRGGAHLMRERRAGNLKPPMQCDVSRQLTYAVVCA